MLPPEIVMNLRAKQVGVFHRVFVASQHVQLGPGRVPDLTRRPFAVLRCVFDKPVWGPNGWFARLLFAHETSLLMRRRVRHTGYVCPAMLPRHRLGV
jgi:hypothetical protein